MKLHIHRAYLYAAEEVALRRYRAERRTRRIRYDFADALYARARWTALREVIDHAEEAVNLVSSIDGVPV